MYYFFDESGDFAVPAHRFDSYVQAALICPDSQLNDLDDFVHEQQAVWHVPELHASDLTDKQLLEIGAFINESPCQLLAHATDTIVVTTDQIAQFRLDQAATLSRNREEYRRQSTQAIGSPVPEIEKRIDREIKRSGLEAQMNHGEFVQARFLIELILDALQKSLLFYFDDRWRADLTDFHFVLDGKLPTKMAAGEKYLNDVIVPAIGSRASESLTLVDTWHCEPRHPFIEKFCRQTGRIRGQEVTGVIDLTALFERGLQFARSHEHAGLQLVDAVAYIVRRAVLEPANHAIQDAYDSIRASLRNERQVSLTINRLAIGEEDRASVARYRRLTPLAGPG